MLINTTTRLGLKQKLGLFEPHLTEEEVRTTIKKIEDESELSKQHQKRFADYIHLPGWQEINLVLEGSEPPIDPKDLELITTTSYHLQAVRQGGADDITPISVMGLVLTKDDKFIHVIRGGNVDRGKVRVSPGGTLSNRYDGNNLLFAAFYEQLLKELGVKKDGSSRPFLMGYLTDPGVSKGVIFLFYIPVKESSPEINEKYQKAFSVYQKALLKGVPEVEARKEIKSAGFPNTNAWKQQGLIFVDNDPKLIDETIKSRIILQKGTEYPLSDTGRGALILCRACPENYFG
ncbi:hypothetical protein HQ584_12925 [Patescibacteria group bacterium]|nr:hypothetical protein [Patescibacteria group bacterium]